MTTPQAARAYQQFTDALAKWWATPGRHAFRKPELADFAGEEVEGIAPSMPVPDRGSDGALPSSPSSKSKRSNSATK